MSIVVDFVCVYVQLTFLELDRAKVRFWGQCRLSGAVESGASSQVATKYYAAFHLP
jgi:hypothetical protein